MDQWTDKAATIVACTRLKIEEIDQNIEARLAAKK